MLVGDSVINGGSQTDQSRTVSSMLQRRLHDEFHRPGIVGNISAGSWGPPNELAYLKKFGLFDADLGVFVFNNGDACDVMTFQPTVGVSEDFPDHAPVLALWEGWMRYAWPRIGTRFQQPAPPPANQIPHEQAISTCLSAIQEMVQMSRAAGAKA